MLKNPALRLSRSASLPFTGLRGAAFGSSLFFSSTGSSSFCGFSGSAGVDTIYSAYASFSSAALFKTYSFVSSVGYFSTSSFSTFYSAGPPNGLAPIMRGGIFGAAFGLYLYGVGALVPLPLPDADYEEDEGGLKTGLGGPPGVIPLPLVALSGSLCLFGLGLYSRVSCNTGMLP
jgi:hypothetical protein